MEVFDALGGLGLVPVIEISDELGAEPLVAVLAEAGLPCAEITLRTPAGLLAIERVARSFPTVLIGAGTVLSPEQAVRARDAGARFVVTPGFNPAVVERCLDEGIPVLPGVATPTEIEMALARGLGVVKIFPASILGGTAFLRALSAPYRDVRFVPTGGIGVGDLADYLAVPSVLAVGGSWIASRELVTAGDLATIHRLATEAVAVVGRAREVATAPGGWMGHI
jgi:2-dehydro-3-deoxyphosphogluconate aldolase/(4S)-4-hydroxy-2-oxoglutarate aldolase